MGYTPAVPASGRPNDLNPEAFGHAGNYGSQTEFQNVYTRPIPQQVDLFDRHIGYVGFAMLLSAMGASKGCKNPTFGHYELPWEADTFTIASVVTPAGGAGNNIVIALSADDMYNTSVTVSAAAVQTSYPIVGDVVEFYDRVQAQVITKDVSVTPHRLTLRPLVATDDLDASALATNTYGIVYNLHAEGSGLPASRAPRIITYSNGFGVIKHKVAITGHELTNAVYHQTIPGDNSSAGQSIYQLMKHEDLKRYEMSRSGILLFGQAPDNLTQLVSSTNIDTPVDGTEGFIDFALTSGNVQTINPAAYTLADFDTAAQLFYDERAVATNGVCSFDGPNIATVTENVFQQILVQNLDHAIDRLIPGFTAGREAGYYEDLDHDASDATLSFGYTAIKKNGIIFHMKRLSEFNDVKRAGSSDYGYQNYRIITPTGYITDRSSGDQRAMVGYEYKKMNDYSREHVMGDLPGAGVGGDNTPYGRAVHEFDTYEKFMISHIGGHFACANKIVTQRP